MLRVMIVDDESPARIRLKKLLSNLRETERVEIVAEAENGVAALEVLKKTGVDLLFLDINMPELDGFGVLERLHPDDRPIVVFTTAYDEYAIKAFEENAVDYLLKPFTQDRIEQAVSRVEKIHNAPEARERREEHLGKLLDWLDSKSFPESERAETESQEFLKQISIPFRDRILIVPVERLVSAEISEGITRLYILDTDEATNRQSLREHIVAYTLDTLGANLDPARFMRVHRAAIIQVGLISEMIPWFSGRYKLVLATGHEVIASRERSKALKERLMM